MLTWVTWTGAILVGAIVLDRLLLGAESRGWLYYRRTRGVRGRAMYHAQELDSIFNPGMRHVQEAHVKEEQEEDESGDPPAEGRTEG